MVYVVMTENENDDREIGRGDIIGAFNELEKAIESVRKVGFDDIYVCIYKLNMDQLYYIDINDIFHCVWKNF